MGKEAGGRRISRAMEHLFIGESSNRADATSQGL